MEDNELFDEPALEEEVSTTQQSAPVEAEAAESYDDLAPAQRSTYVRQRAPRRTQEAIDDLAEDDNPVEYAHESNVTVGGSIGDRKYRKARSEISQFQKNNRYGQYLEIPKGRRSIFASRERARRRNSVLALFVVVVLLVLAAMFLWNMMQNILG